MATTLIIGASSNPMRYSYLATQRLLEHGYEIELIGRRTDVIFNKEIRTQKVDLENIDTVTMYLSTQYQTEYYEYIIQLSPRRVIFNPGTENPEFENLLLQNGIRVEEVCTLILLSSGHY